MLWPKVSVVNEGVHILAELFSELVYSDLLKSFKMPKPETDCNTVSDLVLEHPSLPNTKAFQNT